MRTYAGALALLVGVFGVQALAADLPTKKPAPEEILAPDLPSSWHYEITGYGWGTDVASQTGVGPFPTSPSFINFLKILQHFQGGLMTSFVARNDNYIAGVDVILSRIGGGTNFRDPTSALFGDHANSHTDTSNRDRFRRPEDSCRAAEPPALWHGGRSLFL